MKAAVTCEEDVRATRQWFVPLCPVDMDSINKFYNDCNYPGRTGTLHQ